MSFLANLANMFFSQNKILITVEPYSTSGGHALSGFTSDNNYKLNYTMEKGVTVGQLKQSINKYRGPSNQINACYIGNSAVTDNYVINDACNVRVAIQN